MRDADALIEGMRPGAMERLGLGPEACQALNPRLVYGRMTGWGQDGPLAQAAGHDNNYAAVSGALWGCAPADARPVSPFATLGDIGGGAMYLMTGLLAGIVQARATGRGTVVDAAIVDGAAHMLNLMLHARQRGLVADERGHSIHDSAPFYETYACADGGFITVGAIEPQFHALLLDRLGLAGAAAFQGPQWDRAAWPARRAQLQVLFASRPRAHWQQLLEGSDACFGAVLSPVEAASHPHLQGARRKSGAAPADSREAGGAQHAFDQAHQRDQARPGIAFQRAALRAVDGQGDREHPVLAVLGRGHGHGNGLDLAVQVAVAAAKAVLGQVAPRIVEPLALSLIHI